MVGVPEEGGGVGEVAGWVVRWGLDVRDVVVLFEGLCYVIGEMER